MSPKATVTANDKIVGKSGQTRQIDVSVRERVGEFEVLIVIDCKDYKKRIDIKGVEEFKGLAEDVSANKAAMVAASGYTEGAKRRAQQAGIDLLRPLDSGDHPWKTLIAIPSVCETTYIQAYSLKLENSIPQPFSISGTQDWRTLEIFDLTGKILGTAEELVFQRWAAGNFPLVNDTIEDFQFVKNPIKVRDGLIHHQLCEIKISATLMLKSEFYIGEVPLQEVRGMANELTGKAYLKNIRTETVEFEHIRNSWRKVDNLNELSIDPALTTRAINIPDRSTDKDLDLTKEA